MDTPGVIQILILFILLVLSAFFSSAETSMTTVNTVRIRALAEEGSKRALILQRILLKQRKMLSAVLIGNNIVNISASALATTLTIRLFGNVYVGLATGILTILILLFGEIIPKNWAVCNADKIALKYSKPIYVLMFALTPLIFLVDHLSGAIMKIFRISSSNRSAMTETELKTYVDVSHEDGVIETEEREMIYNLFDFSDAVARDVMIPRIDVVSISADAKYQELLDTFKEFMYTRIPVYENDKDHIVGIVNIKDFLLVENKRSFHAKNILRPCYYTYELKKTSDLLMEMREKSASVSIVLNEYGAAVGMITTEDLLEEIVGEIRDEYDEDEKELIQKVSDREYIVEGNMKLDDINDALGCDIDSEDYDSIGGILMELLDRLPDVGDSATTEDGIILTVVEKDEKRVKRVRIQFPEKKESDDNDEDVVESTVGDYSEADSK